MGQVSCMERTGFPEPGTATGFLAAANHAAVLRVPLEGLAAGFADDALEFLPRHAGGGLRARRVSDRLVHDGADEIVRAEEERDLRQLRPDLDPVRLDVREIVEKEPRGGNHAEVRLAGR